MATNPPAWPLPVSIGWLIALLVFIAAFVLGLTGRMDWLQAILFMALSLARMIP